MCCPAEAGFKLQHARSVQALEHLAACRVLFQQTVDHFVVVTQQVALSLKANTGIAPERLPSAQQLMQAVLQASKAFQMLMRGVQLHDSNHLVFQTAVRAGGTFVDHFLKVRTTALLQACYA